ncbi:hypothetical protein ACJX0J_030071, partial [Zea mays]
MTPATGEKDVDAPFTEEMRAAAMRLHSRDQARDGTKEAPLEPPVAKWQTTVEGTIPLLLLRRLLGLPDLDRSVKIPPAVKACILDDAVARDIGVGQPLSNGRSSLLRSRVGGERFLWACCSGSSSTTAGTSGIILTWHIATCILEVRHPYQCGGGGCQEQLNRHKIAATHLSRYCAYLMA